MSVVLHNFFQGDPFVYQQNSEYGCLLVEHDGIDRAVEYAEKDDFQTFEYYPAVQQYWRLSW